ncbi:MAG: hypothetical protein LAP38_14095 [Acidobacteriia bacterium]|nr:hypothetical protein [Terriglobia bacterium]
MSRSSTLLVLAIALWAGASAYAQDERRVLAKKPVDATNSVMLVETRPAQITAGAQIEIGVFVVAEKDDQVRQVLDRLPLGATAGYPTLELIGANSAYLHFYSDYGMYQGSIKYSYDLAGGQPAVKIPYSMVALTDSWKVNGELYYAASFGRENHAIIAITPREGDANPSYKILEGEGRKPAPSEEDAVSVVNTTPPGQPHQPSGISIREGGIKKFYPVPVPSMAQHREAVPEKQAPGEIENDIGPYVQVGGKIWFANTFYDSEGVSGVGAIGAFDIAARQYDMRYLAEIAPWSGSAMLADGDDLWVGLMRRPEGANYGAGLLRYDTRTGAVSTVAIADLIHTIDRVGNALYCGTSHGLYVVRGGKVTQFRFEPDESGRLVMVARAIR